MLALLLARQRTGSGALGTILDRNPALFYTGEVLHPDDVKNKASFFGFVNASAERIAAFSNPNQRESVVKAYFEELESAKRPRTPVIDVKYRSLHHWNLGWQGFFDRPWIISYARQQRMPILLLRRRNYAATFVSGRLAELNRVWHTKDSASISVTSLNVAPRDLLGFLKTCAREDSLIDEWLANYDRVLPLEYEDVFDSQGLVPESVCSRIATFLGIGPFPFRSPIFIKQAPPALADSISNFDEVAASLQGTEFRWMLGD